MPHPSNEPAWSQEPSLTDGQRWRAFKAWEAARRVEFSQSERAREEYEAWLMAEPKPELGGLRHAAKPKPKVYHFS